MSLLFVCALSTLLSAELVRNETGFDSRYTAAWAPASIVVFPFDSRALYSADLDHLTISRTFHAVLCRAFRDRTGLKVAADRILTLDDTVRLTTMRDTASINHKVPDYNEREVSDGSGTELAQVHSADLHLNGTIDSYEEGRTPEESYIRVTLRLVDGASKTVYWVTTMEGSLKHVANAIADSTVAAAFRGPTPEEERTAGWQDPRSRRVHTTAWGLSVGSFTPLGTFRKAVRDDADLSADLHLALPMLQPIRNRISLGLIDRIRNRPGNGSSYNLVPLTLSFLYDLPFIKVPSWTVYPRADIGFIASWLSFPGVSYQKDGRTDLMFFGGLGAGTEYVFPSLTAYKSPFFFHLPRSGLFLDLMFYFTGFRDVDFGLSVRPVFSVSGGFKIYL
jgi:hypothetical protein